MVLGKDKSQYQGLRESHGNYSLQSAEGQGHWEGNNQCSGKDQVFGVGPIPV